MERRRLGRTGHDSTVAILGAAAFALSTPQEAAEGFGVAMDAGVNHLDIAPQYGAAEDVIGPLVPTVRDRLFVGCKTLRKSPDGVRDQLETSLRKLGCDQFDLYQAHGVTGNSDILCRVVARDNTHLQDVINAMLHTGAIQRSTSSISMTRQIPYRIDPLIRAAGADEP